MKVSYNWLSQYFNSGLSIGELTGILTDTGLEVGGVEIFESVKGGLKGLVVGEVLTKESHPNADRLSITTVELGDGNPVQIVCGAPNVDAGQKVVVAQVGTVLYTENGESFKIKKGKIRGEESVGMICAEDEIGLGQSHDGIMVLDSNAKTGTPASEYFNIANDYTIEIDLTPNRSDAFSHIGVGRDLIAALKASEKIEEDSALNWPSVEGFSVDNRSRPVEIQVEDKTACPRYSGVTISNITVSDSPDWLKNRLKSIGISPINNVVDVTNFVLHELGQPLHAFDADKIEGNKVVVKQLENERTFITLDEVERKLSSEDLMICDAKEGMCIAGVFGGQHSGVADSTTAIFLESAYFNPVSIRKTAKRHGLNTDASFRFERGTDPNITVYALKRAALLIKEVAGGEVSSEITDIYTNPIQEKEIKFRYENCDRLIGKAINRSLIKVILRSLDIKVIGESDQGLTLSLPLYRTDVLREVDVIEEILRIYGYNNIELPTSLRTAVVFNESNNEKIQNTIANLLSSNGFSEIMSNSLTKSSYYENESSQRNVKMMNPLSSELEIMRQDLLYGGLEAIAYNQNRRNKDLKLYEFGKSYLKEGSSYQEKRHMALFISGKIRGESWMNKDQKSNFYDLKKSVNLIVDRLGIKKGKFLSTETQQSIFEYGLNYNINGTSVVDFGSVSQDILNKMGINESVFYADFDWDRVMELMVVNKTKYKPVSKYPSVRRDLALLMDESTKFEEIEKLAFKVDRKLLKEVSLFDVYKGKDLEKGKKSYAISFLFSDENKTLKDEQVDQIIKKIYNQLVADIGLTLRQGEI